MSHIKKYLSVPKCNTFNFIFQKWKTADNKKLDRCQVCSVENMKHLIWLWSILKKNEKFKNRKHLCFSQFPAQKVPEI